MISSTVSNKVRAAYGIGDYAICLYWSGVGLYLLYFYTDVVGITPLLAGWIYALGIAWDAITDPFMGYLAERTRTKMGSYRPYIFYGAIPLALSFILLFWVPPFEGIILFIFLLTVNLLHRTCFTIVSVPYSSLTARITDDSDERTKLTTARMIGASFGTLSVSALGFPIVLWFGGGDEAIGFNDICFSTLPLGRPRCDMIIVRAPFFDRDLSVFRLRLIRESSVILPSSRGTFKSLRKRTFFPLKFI